MQRGNEKICTNCEIHEEKKPKTKIVDMNKLTIDKKNSSSGRESLNSYKTNSELNKAEVRLPKIGGREFNPKNILEKISEEKSNEKAFSLSNKNFTQSDFGIMSLQNPKRNKGHLAQSDMRFNKFSFNRIPEGSQSLIYGPQTNLRGSIYSNNSYNQNLVQESIISDDKSLSLMNEINQQYLNQIKMTLDEIQKSTQLSQIEKFQMMKEVMAEYKSLVNSNK